MKKNPIKIMFAAIFILIFSALFASAGSPVTEVNGNEKGENTDLNEGMLKSALTRIEITGGISAGYFYASNPGENGSDDEFLLSNFLVELSSSNKGLPMGFGGAFGETSTPSLLDTPENNNNFDIEYASLTLKPITDLSIEAGLLQPNAGFENTYTFNNKNVILGAVASQQPYNAYGARIGYDHNKNDLSFWGGYYKERLDDDEYNSPDYAWEIGLSASISKNTYSLYHYNVHGQRSLTGVVIESTIQGIDIALNLDYWRWDNRIIDLQGNKSSIGVAVYICPNFNNFSIPVRLEYINQDSSRIYIDTINAERISSVTVSPTWYFDEKTYVRVESVYVNADSAFIHKDGISKDNRISLAIEVGLLF